MATAALTTLFAKQDKERATVGAPPQQGGPSPYFLALALALASAFGLSAGCSVSVPEPAAEAELRCSRLAFQSLKAFC